MIIVHALALVEGLLGSGLVLISLHTTGDTVLDIGSSLLDLVLSGLGRVRSEFLLGLCDQC